MPDGAFPICISSTSARGECSGRITSDQYLSFIGSSFSLELSGSCLMWHYDRKEGVSHGLGLSEGLSTLLPLDAQPTHPIVPLCRRGTTDRAAHAPCHPGPSMATLALDGLRMLLAHVRLLGLDVPLVGASSIHGKPRDPKGLKEFLPLQKDVVLPSPEHIRYSFPRGCSRACHSQRREPLRPSYPLPHAPGARWRRTTDYAL